jgi:hypothetical protein
MEALNWVGIHWFELLQSSTILFAAYTIHKDAEARRVGNGIAITAQFRNMMSEVFDHPELLRVDDANANLQVNPISETEAVYAGMRINHLSMVYQAIRRGEFIKLEGLRADTKVLMSLPIPKAVWEKVKSVQNEDFMNFVESCLQ